MVHYLAHSNGKYHRDRDASYIYDMHNRLEQVKDSEIPNMDEMFAYDAQGRIVHQARGEDLDKLPGARHNYIAHSNRLLTVTSGSGADLDGNLIADHSKKLTIAYDWRGMPTEFLMETTAKNELNPAGNSSRGSVRLRMAYDGSGRRVSKTRERKTANGDWIRESFTHYTGIGTEVRENYSEGSFQDARVVVNMPHGLGRYGISNVILSDSEESSNSQPNEFYLKNHLGSTMLVYATGVSADGSIKAAYDYRAFGEQITLSKPTEKVTENFTGKERDDKTELNYFGARYLDPMIGLWTSVDPARQFSSPYLYVGNGYNPVGSIDPDGNDAMVVVTGVGKNVKGSYKGQPYSYTRYRTDVYLNTEKWNKTQTIDNTTPDKSFWFARDAWGRSDYNKAVISGSGEIIKSQGKIGNSYNPAWLAVVNDGRIATFDGIGPNGETSWLGLSFHKGGPLNSDGCLTSPDFPAFRETLTPDLDAGNPVIIEIQPFMPQDKEE